MADSAHYALHRPELHHTLECGEKKIVAMMAGSARNYTAGHVLIEGNTEHGYVYRLLAGWAGRMRTLSDGRDQIILVFLPGDLFAVKSMFVARHPDSVLTLSSARIERIGQRELTRAYREDADIAERCMWQVIEEERRLHNWVVSLGQGSAEERLAMLLFDFHGRLVLSGTIERGAASFPMPLTQGQLADHLGITAIHTNRVLRMFRESRVATVREGMVTLHDLPALVRIARPLLDPYERSRAEYV